jgi:MFS family permease
MTALFSGAALMNAAMAVASSVAAIVAGDRFGARWAAIPNTAGIVGTGIGALVLTWLMNHHGRRIGLLSGYLTSACGAVLAIAAVAARDVIALSAGMLLLGLGNAGAQLSRYVAAGLYPAERRGFAISTVVWAGAIGAVGGPLLLGPSSEIAASLGWTGLAGPYLFVSLATLGAALAAAGGGTPARTTAKPAAVAAPRAGDAPGTASAVSVDDVSAGAPVVTATIEGASATFSVVAAGAASHGTSMSPAGPTQDTAGIATGSEAVTSHAAPAGGAPGMVDGVPAGDAASRVRFREVARASGVALAVMVTAQVVMVAVMTVAPLDMHMHGQGLGAVGMTLSAHTLGMFAFSPLTGRLLDSVGARPVMFAGLIVLAGEHRGYGRRGGLGHRGGGQPGLHGRPVGRRVRGGRLGRLRAHRPARRAASPDRSVVSDARGRTILIPWRPADTCTHGWRFEPAAAEAARPSAAGIAAVQPCP